MAIRFSWRLVLLAGSVLTLVGCGGLKSPAIAPAGASLIEAGAAASTIGVGVELSNPNDEELELRDFKYRVFIEGHEVYEGRRAAQATLPAGGTRVVILPAVIHRGAPGLLSAEEHEIRFAIRGTLTYITPGQIAEILFDSGVRKPEVEFGHEGTATLAPGG